MAAKTIPISDIAPSPCHGSEPGLPSSPQAGKWRWGALWVAEPGGAKLQKQENSKITQQKLGSVFTSLTSLGKHFVFSQKRNKNVFLAFYYKCYV